MQRERERSKHNKRTQSAEETKARFTLLLSFVVAAAAAAATTFLNILASSFDDGDKDNDETTVTAVLYYCGPLLNSLQSWTNLESRLVHRGVLHPSAARCLKQLQTLLSCAWSIVLVAFVAAMCPEVVEPLYQPGNVVVEVELESRVWPWCCSHCACLLGSSRRNGALFPDRG